MACMKAYMVVGPTKPKPRFFKSLDSAWAAFDVVSERATSRQQHGPALLGQRLEAPDVVRQRAEFSAQLQQAPGVADGRFDLAPVPHDARIGQQALDVRRAEIRHLLGIELREAGTEGLALVQDGDPAQAGLEAFQASFSKRRRSSATGKPHS